jgi:hypothetical protein
MFGGMGARPTALRGCRLGWTSASRFFDLGMRGGTRRLKLATTSGGEWRLRVGCARQ